MIPWRRRWSPQAVLLAFAVYTMAAVLGWACVGVLVALWVLE